MYDIKSVLTLTGGELFGNYEGMITGFRPLDSAQQGDLSFFGNDKYANDFAQTQASVVIVEDVKNKPEEFKGSLLLVDNVYTTISKILENLQTEVSWSEGVDASAHIGQGVKIADTADIGSMTVISDKVRIGEKTKIGPQVFIGKGVNIGKRCILYPGVRIMDGCSIGDDVIIHSNTVVGSDGFGFAPNASGELQKIPQIGKVIIENDVEIGANCSIDRGSLKDTIIREGVKLDNLIQVAHNVEIGSNTVIAAQTGIAGSTTLGEYCMIGGQVGIVGHLRIADRTSIQAQSGMIKSVSKPNTQWYGYPAIPYKNYLKSYAQFKNLDDLAKRVQSLEQAAKQKD